MTYVELRARIVSRLVSSPRSTCRIWTGAKSQSGRRGVFYPELRIGPRVWRLNRLVLVLVEVIASGRGAEPIDHARLWQVNESHRFEEGAHSCDDAACLEQSHLAWATHRANIQEQAQRRADARCVA